MAKGKFRAFTIGLIALILALTGICGVAYALTESDYNNIISEITIMHISDIHYIPTYYCYTGKGGDNAFTRQMDYDPKLMLESGSIMSEVFDMIRRAKPDYLLISGDLTSNGERQSLIDVANALRKLQNDVRDDKPLFQIFVTPGNHDVHNRQNAMDYGTGNGVAVDSATRVEFEKIFSSLGFPDITDDEAADFYNDAELSVDKHLPYKCDGSAFVNSSTAEHLSVEFITDDGGRFYGAGGLTYIAYDGVNDCSFISFDTPLANENEGYRTDGNFTDKILSWYENQNVRGTQIGLSHHNILPHYSMEENFTTEYITYDWEDVAERLANKGLRYNFTGHMHASDTANYVSFENNVLYDIETGSTISYSPAIRSVDLIKKSNSAGKIAENIVSELISVSKADFGYLTENGLMPDGYAHLLDADGNIDLPEYINERLFKNMITNMADLYISPRIKDTVKELLAGLIPINFSSIIDKVLDNVINEINAKALKDYEYNGSNVELQGDGNKIYAYVYEIVYKIINYKVGGDMSVNDIFLYCYGSHLAGGEVESADELPQNVRQALENLKNGSVTADLVNVLLNSENGLIELIENIGDKHLNLTAGLSSVEKTLINTLLKSLDLDIRPDDIVLDSITPLLMKSLGFESNASTLKDAVSEITDKYLTKSLTDGLGGILASIIESFATDTTFDGKIGVKTYLKVSDSDKYSYNGKYTDYAPTIENGRLPSMATVTFGKNPSRDKNFVWFTSKYIDGGEVQYKKTDSAQWITARADTELVPYAHTLMDFGIFSTKNVKTLSRHNVRLTGLLSGVEYEYRIGNSESGYFSETGIFKTASDNENTPFEAAVIADLQGMVNSVYENANKLLELSNSLFETKRPDFVINLGDFVDDGLNSNQWNYALNTPNGYWKNVTQVMAAGNHEKDKFDAAEYEYPNGNYISDIAYSPYNLYYDLNGVGLDAELYYSFDYSAVHFTVLDTNDLADEGKLSQNQYDWLAEDLSASNSKYKIVLMHKGLYSSGSHSFDKEVEALRGQLSGLFYNTGVDIVFQGHDHTYSESVLLDADGKAAKDGVLYVTMGSMGDKFYNYKENDKVDIEFGSELHNPTLHAQTFGKLTYDGEKLSYNGYIFDGEKLVGVREYAKNELWLWILSGCLGGICVAAGITVPIVNYIKKKKSDNGKTVS